MNLTTRQEQYLTAPMDAADLTGQKLVGFYSLDADGEYQDDFSQLKFVSWDQIKSRKVNMDLNHNIEKRIIGSEVNRGIGGLLRYLEIHRDVLDVFSKSPITMDQVSFACCRGLLRALCHQPYQNVEPFRLNVSLINGVIYMHALDAAPETDREMTERVLTRETNREMTEKVLKACAWGVKFEQYMVSDETNGDPDLSSPVYESCEFNCIYTASLGRHKLFYNAETDCFLVDESTKKSDEEWERNTKQNCGHDGVLEFLNKHKKVELKTSRVIEHEKHRFTFRRHKSLFWWLQSYFAGIDMVVCGFKNDDGIVTEIKQYETSDLLSVAQGWDKRVCLNFCDAYLTFIKQALTNKLKRQGYAIEKDVDVRSYPPVNLILHRNPRCPVSVESPWPNEYTSGLEDWFLDTLTKV